MSKKINELDTKKELTNQERIQELQELDAAVKDLLAICKEWKRQTSSLVKINEGE